MKLSFKWPLNTFKLDMSQPNEILVETSFKQIILTSYLIQHAGKM